MTIPPIQQWKLPQMHISRKWLTIAAVIFVACIGMLLLLDKVIMPDWVHSQPVVVMPNLVGMNQRDALAELNRMKFNIAVGDTRPDEKYPKDVVLYQTPYPGEQVKEGRKAFLTISSGREIMQLPNVVGMEQQDAKIKLQNAGLTIGDITTASSGAVAADNVIAQSPAPGSRVGIDAHISLVVSSGPPKPSVVIPPLTGKTLAEAQTTLQSLGLVFGTITYERNTNVLPSTVTHQQPAPGDSVVAGSPVNLTVANGD